MKGRFAGRLISAGIVLLLILMVPQNSFANPPLAENNYVEISGKVIVRGGNPIESLIFIWYGDINRTLSVSPDGTFYTVIFTNQTSILNITAVSPYGHINRTYQIPYLPYRIHTEFRFNATNHINPPTSPQVYINTSKEEHNLAHSPDFTVSFYIKNEPIICGDKITLKVLIRNIGTYYLRVKYNVLIDDVIVAEKKVNLTGYAYEDVLNVSSPAAHGTHTLKIIVDPYNEVEELIEDNNFMATEFFSYKFKDTIDSAISEINGALSKLSELPPKYKFPIRARLLIAKFHLKMAKRIHPLLNLYMASKNIIRAMKTMYRARIDGYFVPLDNVSRALKLTVISSYIKHREYSLCKYILNIQDAYTILAKMEDSYHSTATKHFVKTLEFAYKYSVLKRTKFLSKSYEFLTDILSEAESFTYSTIITSKLRIAGIIYAPDVSIQSITYSDGNLTVTLRNDAFTVAENVDVTVEISSEKQILTFSFDRVNPYSTASETQSVNLTPGLHEIKAFMSPQFLDSNNANNIFSSVLNVAPPGITAVRTDWWIDTRVVLENGEREFYGNITINATGELILRNYSLWVISKPLTTGIIYNVTVYGKLVIENKSNLTSRDKDSSYWLHVYGEIEVLNGSAVCMMYGNTTVGGIIAYPGAKVRIENSSVEYGRTYDIYADTSNVSAKNIKIINLKYDKFADYHGAYIQNMNAHWNGILMENATIDAFHTNILLENLTAKSCSYTVLSSDSNITMKNSIIYVENAGIYAKNRITRNITVINTKFVGKGFPTIDYREGDKAVIVGSADSFLDENTGQYSIHNGALPADTFYYYFALKNHSWSDENITLMIYAGHLGKYKNSYGYITPSANLIDVNTNGISDFNEAEIDYRNDSVTPQNFTSVLNNLATTMLPGTEILIVMENHGWYASNGTHYFKFEYNTTDLTNPFHKLWAPTMQSTLDLFRQRNIKVKLMVFSCASGGFVESVAVSGTLYVAEVSDKQTGLAYFYDGPNDQKYGVVFGHKFFTDLNNGSTIFDAYMKNRYAYQYESGGWEEHTPLLGEYNYIEGRYGIYCYYAKLYVNRSSITKIKTGIYINYGYANITDLRMSLSAYSYSEGNAGIYSIDSQLFGENIRSDNMNGPSLYAERTTAKIEDSEFVNQSYGSVIITSDSNITIRFSYMYNISSRDYKNYVTFSNFTVENTVFEDVFWGAFTSAEEGWSNITIINSILRNSGNSFLLNSTVKLINTTIEENTGFDIHSSFVKSTNISLYNESSIYIYRCYLTTITHTFLFNNSGIVIKEPQDNATVDNISIINSSYFSAEDSQINLNIHINITNVTAEYSEWPVTVADIVTLIQKAYIRNCSNIGIDIVQYDDINPSLNRIEDVYFDNCTVGLNSNASLTIHNLSAFNCEYGVMLEYLHTVYLNDSYFSQNDIGIYAGPSPFIERGKTQQYNIVNITAENNTYAIYANQSQVPLYIYRSNFINNTYQIYASSSELYLDRCHLRSHVQFRFHRTIITWSYGSRANIILNSSEAFISNTTAIQASISLYITNKSFVDIFNSTISGGEISEPVICLWAGWKYSCFARINGEAVYLKSSDIHIDSSKIMGVRGIVLEYGIYTSVVNNTYFEVKTMYGEIWIFEPGIGYIPERAIYTGNCIEMYDSNELIVQNSSFNNSVTPIYASIRKPGSQIITLHNITVENSTNGIIIKNTEIALRNSTISNIEKDGLYIRDDVIKPPTIVDNSTFTNCEWAIHSIGINVTMKNVIFNQQREGWYLVEFFLYVNVYNKTTQQPIENAIVKIYNSTGVFIEQQYTNPDGYAKFILKSMSIDNQGHTCIYYPYKVVATYGANTNYTWVNLTDNIEISLGL